MSRSLKKKKISKYYFFSLVIPFFLTVTIILILAWTLIFNDTNDISRGVGTINTTDETPINSKSNDFSRAVHYDSTDDYITLSEPLEGYDDKAGNSALFRYTGRRINIALTGLDSRLGTNSNHADANHILSILVDSGKIEIISIPRDTPADAGMPDSTGQNKLTVVRAVRGRDAYHQELIKIAQIDKIHYFIELGFSQVIGILDFFGFRDSKSTLQVLRSRKGLGGDDFQRCYNQAQFIRQLILKHFDDIKSGFLTDLIIRGGLALVSTNLSFSKTIEIIKMLADKNFPKSEDDITIKIRPPIGIKFKVYNLLSNEVMDKLKTKIESFNKEYNEIDTAKINVYEKLKSVISLIEPDTSRSPQKVISSLKTFYQQRAWLQIEDQVKRDEIRNRFESCLTTAYLKLNQLNKAKEVKKYFEIEREFFRNKINKQ
ncbi:MAG: hypothetical protein ACUVQ1_06650 [Candidatus Kapaibacteriales bacterium]